MSQIIESMESRILFTASVMVIKQDLSALASEGVAAKADLKAALTAATADTKTVKADVVAAHPTSAQRALLNAYTKDEKAAAAKYKVTVSGILASGTRAGAKLESALLSLEAHPTSTVIQTKVQADLAALQAIFSSTVVSTVESNASTTVTDLSSDLNAIGTNVPSAQTDVMTTEAHFDSDLTTLSTQASVIQADIAALAGDLA